MKIGMQLHPDRGVDAVMEEARMADQQGYDSIWLSDHLMRPYTNDHKADGPLDYFVLATALGAVTSRTRLGWNTLNLAFRPVPVLAKMLATLDQITHGRVIASLGSGWLKDEYEAYNLNWYEDHDERADFSREAALLMKELWTHPAPQETTFEGKFVQVYKLPFNPEPYQKPHIPIWWGGDSEATLQSVKEVGDGWIPLRSGTIENVTRLRQNPEWPKDITIIVGRRIIVAETHDEALAEATAEYERGKAAGAPGIPPTLEAFVANNVIGSPDECLQQLAVLEDAGINYMRCSFTAEAPQERVSRLLIPRLDEVPSGRLVARA
jgi:alkanesulfonate monooxygenase SsuD/methylene tetrahydromethanopterin reductase-like flavin-dependent oxidoreductase (luciferase family)